MPRGGRTRFLFPQLHGRRQGFHQRGARVPEAVHAAGFDECFERAAVRFLQVKPLAEVRQVREGSGLALFHEGGHGPLAHALHRTEAITNGPRIGHRELEVGVIHIGRQHHETHRLGLVDERHYLVRLVHVGREHGGHEVRRVVHLEPRRLVRQQRIGSGVRLVEAVACKLLHEVEDVGSVRLLHPEPNGSFHEDRPLLGHLLGLLLAHGAAEHVGTAKRVARQHLRNLHHLFLIQNDAVRRLQDARELRMQVIDGAFDAAMLAVDIVVHHARLQRARTEQGHQRDDVVEAVRLEPLLQVLHAAAFQLEHRGGLAGLQQFVSGRVVQRQQVHVQRWLTHQRAFAIDAAQRPIDDREGAQPEKVEFHQACGFDVIFVELRDDAAAAFFAVQRRKVREHRRRDNHTTGVHASVARQPFELHGQVDDLAHVRIGFVELFQLLFFFECIFELDPNLEGNELGDTVAKAIALP